MGGVCSNDEQEGEHPFEYFIYEADVDYPNGANLFRLKDKRTAHVKMYQQAEYSYSYEKIELTQFAINRARLKALGISGIPYKNVVFKTPCN